MNQMRIEVPTYYATGTDGKGAHEEFDDPHVPVLVCEADGVRIVLGSFEWEDSDVPDVHIERRPKGWAIFVHPTGGGEASGYVYLMDDGRSFLVPESGSGETPACEVTTWKSVVAEIDRLEDEDAR